MNDVEVVERIRVRKETATVGLGHMIVSHAEKGHVVVLQAVAAAAVNQAVKGVGVANQILGRRGKQVSTVISFEDAPSSHDPKQTISRIDLRLTLGNVA